MRMMVTPLCASPCKIAACSGAAPRQPGQYLSGDSDRYTFDARKGQDLVVAVSARASGAGFGGIVTVTRPDPVPDAGVASSPVAAPR